MPLALLATLMAALLTTGLALAQDSPALQPDSLEFNLGTGDSLTLYFTLTTPVDLTNLVVENNGLINDERTANIPPDQVVINPASGDVPTGQQSFTVTIQQPEQPGHFTGQLILRFGEPPEQQALPLALDVTVQAQPQVAASDASPNQILNLRPPWLYLGTCRPGQTGGNLPGNQIVITLEQNGLGEATVNEVKVDPLRATNQSVPGSVMSSLPAEGGDQPPYTTSARTLDLIVKAASGCIPAGAFQSSLRVLVADQVDPVLVPFTVNSKAGLIWPILIALLGILVGAFSAYLNQRVNPLSKAIQRVKEIQELLEKHAWLQALDVQRLAGLLKDIQEMMTGGKEVAKIESSLESLESQIATSEDASKAFIADQLNPAIEALSQVQFGKKIAEGYQPDLEKIGQRVEKGEYSDLKQAQEALEAVNAQLEPLTKIAEVFALIEADYISTNPTEVEALRKDLSEAETLDEMHTLLTEAMKTMPVGGVDFSIFESIQKALREFSPAKATWEKFTASMKIQRWLGVGLTGLFALVGGIIALYGPNATWGASVDDYVTLAIWALSVNVVAGQAFDFKAQLKPQVQPPTDTPPEP
jgi:hypothetical protein